MKTANRLTEADQIRIIACYEKGIGPRAIGEVLGRNERTISSFYSKFKLNFNLPSKTIVKNRKTDGRVGLAIKKMVLEHPRFGVRRFAQMLKKIFPDNSNLPSGNTIAKYLKENGLVKKKSWLKPFINETNRQKRLNFAEKWLGDGTDKLGTVIWSDETMVRSHPFTRNIASYQPKNAPKIIQEKHHTGKYSVMFWGCISKHGRGPLLQIQQTMDSKQYKKVLKDYFIPEATYLQDLGVPVKLMHDNAPAHRAKLIKDYLADSNIEFIEWPAYSPDLNPIENIWAWVKYRLYSDFPPSKNENELIDRVFAIWEQIDLTMCQRYCQDYYKRLEAVKQADGMQTKY